MTDEWWFFPLSRKVCKEGQLSWAFDETEEFFEAGMVSGQLESLKKNVGHHNKDNCT